MNMGTPFNEITSIVVIVLGCVYWHLIYNCAANAWLETASHYLEEKQSSGEHMAKICENGNTEA